jgi:ABC-type cobalamin transport system permease subunit
MQGYLRNPLADPGLFGIGPSAALGAVISLWLGAGGVPLPVWALPVFALAGAAAWPCGADRRTRRVGRVVHAGRFDGVQHGGR